MKPYPHIQRNPRNELEWFEALINLARYLRSPQGCPWDRKQTARDFAAFVTEEAAELNDAFQEDSDEAIEEEWGDTLFTLLATAAAAETENRFTLDHALQRIHEKMIRRHAHIFGEHCADTPEDVANLWKAIKAQEKREKRPTNEE